MSGKAEKEDKPKVYTNVKEWEKVTRREHMRAKLIPAAIMGALFLAFVGVANLAGDNDNGTSPPVDAPAKTMLLRL